MTLGVVWLVWYLVRENNDEETERGFDMATLLLAGAGIDADYWEAIEDAVCSGRG